MAEKIRYGMVGGSLKAFIGDVHRKAANFDPRVELVAGCFSTKESLNKETGEAYFLDSDRVYTNYEEMARAEAAREDGIDFVSIVSPNSTHYPAAKAFLEAGINVVCEKPLCFTIEQAEDLQRTAEEKGLLFAVTYTYTGYCMTRVMKEMIANGKIGRILSVNAEYGQQWQIDELTDNPDDMNANVWRTDPSRSGISNCTGDIGTHIENYVHFVTGLKIKRLLATTNTYGKALDMNANIIVEYENGINGAYWCSEVAIGHYNGLVVRIYGDQGSLEWVQENPDILRYTPKNCATQIIDRNTPPVTEKAGGYARIPQGHPEGFYVAFANIYKDFVSTLLAKRHGEDYSEFAYPTVEHGVAGVKFVNAVIESASNNSKWVEL